MPLQVLAGVMWSTAVLFADNIQSLRSWCSRSFPGQEPAALDAFFEEVRELLRPASWHATHVIVPCAAEWVL